MRRQGDPIGSSRAQGTHAGLSRDQVLRTAIELVDRDGADSLTMRGLARALGIEAMTLYHHVGSKQALEDAMVEQVLTQALPDQPPSGPWQDVLLDHAESLRRGLAAHPGTLTLFASRPAMTPRNLAAIERILQVLTGAGFSAQTALHLVQAVAGAVVSQSLADANGDTAAVAIGDDLPLMAEALSAAPLPPAERTATTVRALIVGFESSLSR